MFARDYHPRRFLRSLLGSGPFREYCRARDIPLPRTGSPEEWNEPVRVWAEAVRSLPPEAQARLDLELAEVNELAGRDGLSHLLDVAADDPPPVDVPAGPPLALWFFLHRPDLFREVFFRHEAGEAHSWRTARAAAGVRIADPAAAAARLAEEVRDFFRRTVGAGRYCAAEAHALGTTACFAVRVADRIRLVDGFADDGRPAVHRVRPALAVVFAYIPADGTVRLKAPVRAADRVRDLFRRFGAAVLDRPVTGPGEGYDLDRLKRPVLLLPDADDMEAVRVRALHLRYPSRLGRRGVRLESPPGDTSQAMEELLRAHVGERAEDLAVWYAELQVRLRVGDRRTVVIRLWPDRCSLGHTPLGDRLRRCLTRWGLRYA